MELGLQFQYAARMILAGICGGVIGFERENRHKPAGLRTHVIVGVAAALMIITSKYGFDDVLGEYIKLDPARIAASVVTAIGFLGSGVIFARNKTVSGITTSAGIWATVGVGLAIGAGLFALGIVATAMVLTVELFFGRSLHFRADWELTNRLIVDIKGGQKEMEALKSRIEGMGFKIRLFEFTQKDQSLIKATIYVIPPKGKSITGLLEIKEDWIKNMEVKGQLV